MIILGYSGSKMKNNVEVTNGRASSYCGADTTCMAQISKRRAVAAQTARSRCKVLSIGLQ